MALPRRYYNLLTIALIVTSATYLFLYRRSDSVYAYTVVEPDDHLLDYKPSNNGAQYAGPDLETPVYIKTTITDIHSRLPTASPVNASPDTTKQEVNKPVAPEITRIAITESGGSHDEVTAALIHAFGKQQNTEISTYLLLQRYGITDIIHSFNLSSPIAADEPSGAFEASLDGAPFPHILVAATCEIEIVRLAGAYGILLAEGKTFLFCVVHHADRWIEGELVNKIMPWVEKERVHFLGLSEHTSLYLETKCLPKWGVNIPVPIDTLPPVFPVDIKAPLKKTTDLPFALQGDYDPTRRNYTSTLQGLSQIITSTQNENQPPTPNISISTSNHPIIKLHLIGHGASKPSIPPSLTPHISFDENLDYTAFYTLLSRTITLLPSFASPAYYETKASSSVPAALIAGTPLVANEELLEAYSYVPEGAVWKRGIGESEMGVVGRVVRLSEVEHERKRGVVREVCGRLVERNVELVEGWIEGAFLRMGFVS